VGLADLVLVRSMVGTRRDRIGAVVLVCIAVGFFVAALFSHIYHWKADWKDYSFWARRWIFTIGLISVGILARIVFARGKERSRKHAHRDATRKTQPDDEASGPMAK
jgi:hypothetical protein